MPFTKDNARRLRGPGGRKPGLSKRQAKKKASELVRDILEGNAEAVAYKYIRRALGKANADRVLCHAIDKLLPNELPAFQPSFNIAFVRFDDSLQLQAEAVPVTVLASNGDSEECGNVLASKIGKRQNGVEFLNFKDVPGK